MASTDQPNIPVDPIDHSGTGKGIEIPNTLPAWVKYTLKAGLAAVAVIIADLGVILTGNETLANVTFVQWLWISGSVLAAFGVVYVVPNGGKPGV